MDHLGRNILAALPEAELNRGVTVSMTVCAICALSVVERVEVGD